MGISNLFAIKVFKLQRSEVIGVIVPPLLEVLRGLDRRKCPVVTQAWWEGSCE